MGWAALLKISPALLVLYLLLRGQWRAVAAACVTGGGLLVLAALLGQRSDVVLYVGRIVPLLATGSLHTQNQALPAWLARLFLPEANLIGYAKSTGNFAMLSLPVALVAVLAVWWMGRGREMRPLDNGVLILAALLAGPISWDHYSAWAVLALVVMAERVPWHGLPGRRVWLLMMILLAGSLLLALPTPAYDAEAVTAYGGWLRLATGPKTAGLLLWLTVGISLLGQPARNRRNFAGQSTSDRTDQPAHQAQ